MPAKDRAFVPRPCPALSNPPQAARHVQFHNLSQVLEIPPGIYHGYKALEPNSILLYYLTEKWTPDDEEKVPPGHFGEKWETEDK